MKTVHFVSGVGRTESSIPLLVVCPHLSGSLQLISHDHPEIWSFFGLHFPVHSCGQQLLGGRCGKKIIYTLLRSKVKVYFCLFLMKQKNRNERIVWIVCWSHDTLFLLYENEPGWDGSGEQSAWSSPLSLNFSPPLWIPPWLRRVTVPSAPLRLPLPDISTREGSMFLSVSSHHRRPDSDPSHPTPCDASLFEKKKSCPSIINIPPALLYSLPEEEGEREESSLWQRRADWRDIKRRNVPDVPLNFHNKVTPELQVTILNLGKYFQFHVNLHSTPPRNV